MSTTSPTRNNHPRNKKNKNLITETKLNQSFIFIKKKKKGFQFSLIYFMNFIIPTTPTTKDQNKKQKPKT
jgi:hypothetical protein